MLALPFGLDHTHRAVRRRKAPKPHQAWGKLLAVGNRDEVIGVDDVRVGPIHRGGRIEHIDKHVVEATQLNL